MNKKIYTCLLGVSGLLLAVLFICFRAEMMVRDGTGGVLIALLSFTLPFPLVAMFFPLHNDREGLVSRLYPEGEEPRSGLGLFSIFMWFFGFLLVLQVAMLDGYFATIEQSIKPIQPYRNFLFCIGAIGFFGGLIFSTARMIRITRLKMADMAGHIDCQQGNSQTPNIIVPVSGSTAAIALQENPLVERVVDVEGVEEGGSTTIVPTGDDGSVDTEAEEIPGTNMVLQGRGDITQTKKHGSTAMVPKGRGNNLPANK